MYRSHHFLVNEDGTNFFLEQNLIDFIADSESPYKITYLNIYHMYILRFKKSVPGQGRGGVKVLSRDKKNQIFLESFPDSESILKKFSQKKFSLRKIFLENFQSFS